MSNTISTRGGSRRQLEQQHIEYELAVSQDFETAVSEASVSKSDILTTVSHVALEARIIDRDAILGEIFDAAHAQVRKQESDIIALEEFVTENPVLAERQGIPKMLYRAGVYAPAGSTVDPEAEETVTPHRRTGKGPSDGPIYGKSRKLFGDRAEILERAAKINRTHALVHEHN